MSKRHDGRARVELADVEQLLLTVRRPTLVERQIAERYKVTQRTARKYMKAVYDKWAEHAKQFDSKPELREARRNQVRETIQLVIAVALARTEVVKNEDGSVVLDDREHLPDGRRNSAYKTPLTRPRPDLQRVVAAINSQRKLDGLDEPFKLELSGDLGDRLPDVADLPHEVRQHLVRGLEALAPGGDLRKLAGELLTGGGKLN